MEERLVKSADEMIELGRALGSVLTGSSVIALVGDLGAGKTHLTKGICEAIGAEQTTSPTFTLVNEVLGTEGNIYHFDFYRVNHVEELYDLGWDDYIEKDGIVVAEWANMYEEVIPDGALWIKIEHHAQGRRVLIAQ